VAGQCDRRHLSSNRDRGKKGAKGAIPLVFTSGQDPVEDGLSPATTGRATIHPRLGPKRLQILRGLVPGTAVVGFLFLPS